MRYREGKIADKLVVDDYGISVSVTETQFNFDVELATVSGISSVISIADG